MSFLVVDAHTKWIEALPMYSTTAQATIKAMRNLFARFGVPVTVVTDNGSQFISEEFFTFLAQNGVKYLQTPPKHPASNGLAERAVQTLKRGGGKD
jgi:transposase InsO family protein